MIYLLNNRLLSIKMLADGFVIVSEDNPVHLAILIIFRISENSLLNLPLHISISVQLWRQDKHSQLTTYYSVTDCS